MNEISCEICLDLVPLVMDGAASAGSRSAVERHIQHCPSCRALWEGEAIPKSEGDSVLSGLIKRVQTLSAVALGAMVLAGIVVCEGIMQGSSVFFLGAVWIAGNLLKIMLSKDKEIPVRIAALLAAGAILICMGWLANAVLGNPIERNRAKQAAQAYLDEEYPELELEIGEISYASSSATYDVQIIARADTAFTIVYRRGSILYDTYGED